MKLNLCKINPLKVLQILLLNLKILSLTNTLIANNNIRSVILEIKNDRCKIIKILIFCSLSQEHFLGKENKILVF